MSYLVNPRELESVSSLPPADRYHYFINKLADWQQVWSLASADGWALMKDGNGVEAIPVWPAEAYAEICCTGIWEDRLPNAIQLSEWLGKWLPGIVRDNRRIAVFPLPNDMGMLVEPQRIEQDLRRALQAYE